MLNISKKTFIEDFKKKLINMYAENIEDAPKLHLYYALGELIKDYCSKDWMLTNKKYLKDKQIYYFSMEFLIGRLLDSNLLNLGIRDICKEGLLELGIDLEELEYFEHDAGLGNGGLGRLAACFLDSMASCNIPGHGCGIRYQHGFFEQKIVDGYQVEIPENWLNQHNIWETKKENNAVMVKFGGEVTPYMENNKLKFEHKNFDSVKAVPYDTPIIGYSNPTVNTLRLWSAEPVNTDFDFQSFNEGQFDKASACKYSAESISQILYPDDTRIEGKILRLKQQYFFVSAGIQSIFRTYKKSKRPIKDFHKHIAIHINDTHPAVAVAELMRILIDEELLEWNEAWNITTNVIAYTNHTILSEALEKWPVDLFKKLLPRIYMIVEEINRRFCEDVYLKYKDNNKVNKMSIIFNGQIRMAYLAIVGGHSVNGVAKLHTEILTNRELADFYQLYPDKFNNKTNGITHRRWLIQANPKLSELITSTIGDKWIKKPKELEGLSKFASDKSFQNEVYMIKQNNKINLSNFIKAKYNINIDPDSIYDIQAKRMHLYKRQLLNIFNIMDMYYKLKNNSNIDITPRTFIFAAKAAPGYFLAKKVIKLINTVAKMINNDPLINGKIKIIFLENYSVSLAERIIPCADISEQISTATKEASGTGNMKFMMNGALTVATMDGANIEMCEAVGEDNMFIFGARKDEILNYEKNRNYYAKDFYNNDIRLKRIVDSLINGALGICSSEFEDIYKYLIQKNDEFFVLKDFDSYVNIQEKIGISYKDRGTWNKKCIYNIAQSGGFSSDNTIRQYSKDIWGI